MKTPNSCGETGSTYVTSFSGFIGICHLLFSRDFKQKKCLLKIANSAVSNLWNCDCRWMWPKWRSLYDSVNYGFSELWGRFKSRRRIWQSHILFLLIPKYQRSIVNTLNSCFNKYNRWNTRMFLVLNNKVNIFIPLTNWIQHSIFET